MTVVLMAGLGSAVFFGFAQQPTAPSPNIKLVPMQPTSPTSGQQMYTTYCASCHGADGRGNGPAAPAMKARPTDITLLSQRNSGVFPADHIRAVLQFGIGNPAHGSADMPIWADLFRIMDGPTANSEALVNQRVINLTNYLKQIQRVPGKEGF
jgi:mono/diheme cytochrome c family protein